MHFLIKGNQDAFNELYKRYAKKIQFFFYSKLNRDNEKASDFLQDLFLKIIEKPELFDTTKKFSTWIYALANNMCKNEYKKNNIREIQSTNFDLNTLKNESVSTILNINDHEYFNSQLILALSKLDDTQSTTFILRYKDHLSIKEISDIMECSEGTVKSRLFYTIKKLAITLKVFDPKY